MDNGRATKRRWLRGRDRVRVRQALGGLPHLRAFCEPTGETYSRTVIGPDGREYSFDFVVVKGFAALGVTGV